ncbi:MAG TPA: TlpA disulfide reductase family protein [Candidatus Baltobacteraceae bacterium]|nr:TlpA disulfide reductase family protein [Candidatus Baltobacteraceae bacterium]
MKFLAALVLATASATGLAAVHYGAPPPDFSVHTFRGTERLSDLRGKPVVINFWASWCPPCTDELPYFARLAQTYGDRVTIVTVDWNEQPGVAEAYLREHGIALPVTMDQQSKIYRAYSLSEVPDTIVLDADGNVMYVSVGGLSWRELDAAVQKALDATGAAAVPST